MGATGAAEGSTGVAEGGSGIGALVAAWAISGTSVGCGRSVGSAGCSVGPGVGGCGSAVADTGVRVGGTFVNVGDAVGTLVRVGDGGTRVDVALGSGVQVGVGVHVGGTGVGGRGDDVGAVVGDALVGGMGVVACTWHTCSNGITGGCAPLATLPEPLAQPLTSPGCTRVPAAPSGDNAQPFAVCRL